MSPWPLFSCWSFAWSWGVVALISWPRSLIASKARQLKREIQQIPISHWARVIKFRMKRDCDWETDSPQLGVNAATFQLSPDRVSIPRPDHSLSLGTCVQEFSANSRRDFNQLAETDSNSSSPSLSLSLLLRLPLGTADTFAVCAAHIFTVIHFPSAFSSHVVSQLATLLKLTARQIIKTQQQRQQQKKRTRNRKLRSV